MSEFLAILLPRPIQVGGLSKQELLARLVAADVQLNDRARVLFAHDQFTTSHNITP